MKLFKCKKCGNIVELISGDNANITCCETIMTELKENTEDAVLEKHVPYIEVEDDEVYVKIGEVEHPMEENHYIMWIAAQYSDSFIKFDLKPNDVPEAYFDYEEGMKIYAYCNLHGLWMKEVK